VRSSKKKLKEAFAILAAVGLPKPQQNERSALCLLALADISISSRWDQAAQPLMGVTPIIKWLRDKYKKPYAPNTRETIRKDTLHQFTEAGITLYNPDEPSRSVNSPKAVYQLSDGFLALIRSYGTKSWPLELQSYLELQPTLAEKYEKHREMRLVPITLATGAKIKLTPGLHNKLAKSVIEQFAPRFAPGSAAVYVGDTGDKYAFFERKLLEKLGVELDEHGKMPDLILYYAERNWLLLVECVTSHGPMSATRHNQLTRLFAHSKAGLVFVTAFPDRQTMSRFLADIAWETEVWIADAPSHLIHFNGQRFLGPYKPKGSKARHKTQKLRRQDSLKKQKPASLPRKH
jgi:hypothetical protein